MKLLNSKTLQRTFWERNPPKQFCKVLLGSFLFMLSFCHVPKQFRAGKNLKHLKLSRWRKIMTNSYWWRSCGTLNYTQSKAICTVLNCDIWGWRRSHLIPLYLHFLNVALWVGTRWSDSDSGYGSGSRSNFSVPWRTLVGYRPAKLQLLPGRQGKERNSFFLG